MARSRRYRRDIFANKNRISIGKLVLLICSAAIIIAGIGGWIYMLIDKDNTAGLLALGGVKQPQAGGVLQPQSNINTRNNPAVTDEEPGNDTDEPDLTRFSKLYYYEADKLQRYLAFEEAHKELTADEVVWRVNAKLDLPFFTDIKVVDDVDRIPLLLNKYYRLPDDYAPEGLVEIANGLVVTEVTKMAFDELAEAAQAEGLTLKPGSTYRSLSYQASLYERYAKTDGADKTDSYCARPGHSEHHTGRTIDLLAPDGTLTDFKNTAESEWVAQNAYKFGFIIRYSTENEAVTGYNDEPWHITYVGKQTSNYMHSRGYGSLEEYFVKCVDHRQPH